MCCCAQVQMRLPQFTPREKLPGDWSSPSSGNAFANDSAQNCAECAYCRFFPPGRPLSPPAFETSGRRLGDGPETHETATGKGGSSPGYGHGGPRPACVFSGMARPQSSAALSSRAWVMHGKRTTREGGGDAELVSLADAWSRSRSG